MKKIFQLVLATIFTFLIAACVNHNTTQSITIEDTITTLPPNTTSDGVNTTFDVLDWDGLDIDQSIANLAGAQALGIKKMPQDEKAVDVSFKRQLNDNSLTTVTYTIITTTTPLLPEIQEKDYLVKIDSDGELEKITFMIDGTEISQDELGFQVYKLYVGREFTLLSLVPNLPYDTYITYTEDTETKGFTIPSRDNVVPNIDSFGIAEFDKTNYLNSEWQKSYVIHNQTGLVFRLDNFPVDEANSGLVVSNGIIYDIKFFEGELLFTSIFRNQTVKVLSYFKDKYGQSYIFNDRFDLLDTETNTLFFTGYTEEMRAKLEYERTYDCAYVLSSVGETIYVQGISPEAFGGEYFIIGDNFERQTIDQNVTYHINSFVMVYNSPGILTYFLEIRNGYAYYEDWNGYLYATDFINHLSYVIAMGGYTQRLINRNLSYIYIVYNSVDKAVYFFDSKGWVETLNAFLPSPTIWNARPDSEYLFSRYLFDEEGIPSVFIELIDNVDYLGDLDLVRYSLDGTTDFKIGLKYIDDEYIPYVYILSEYVAPAAETITLQPINP